MQLTENIYLSFIISHKNGDAAPLDFLTRSRLEDFMKVPFPDKTWEEFNKIIQEFTDSASNLRILLSNIGAR